MGGHAVLKILTVTGSPLYKGFEQSPVLNQHRWDALNTSVWHPGDQVRIQHPLFGRLGYFAVLLRERNIGNSR